MDLPSARELELEELLRRRDVQLAELNVSIAFEASLSTLSATSFLG